MDQQRNNNETRLNNRMHDHEEGIFVMDDTYCDTPVVNNRSKADKLGNSCIHKLFSELEIGREIASRI